MLFVIPGIKCRGDQRRFVAFYLQSPNEEESISLTSAYTPRHADKHWIFIIHSLALSHTNAKKHTQTHLSHSRVPIISSHVRSISPSHKLFVSHTYCQRKTHMLSLPNPNTHMNTYTNTHKRWCKCVETFKDCSKRWILVLFSCGETFENNMFHTDLFHDDFSRSHKLCYDWLSPSQIKWEHKTKMVDIIALNINIPKKSIWNF